MFFWWLFGAGGPPYDPVHGADRARARTSRLSASTSDSAAAGHGRLVLVGGEAGVGKTSLVRAFAEEQARKARVRRGRPATGSSRPSRSRRSHELGAGPRPGRGGRREVFAAALEALGAESDDRGRRGRPLGGRGDARPPPLPGAPARRHERALRSPRTATTRSAPGIRYASSSATSRRRAASH